MRTGRAPSSSKPSLPFQGLSHGSKTAHDAVVGDLDALGGGHLRQRGHAHHGAGERDEETGAVGDFEIAHRDVETTRAAALLRVVGEAVLGLRHAER